MRNDIITKVETSFIELENEQRFASIQTKIKLLN